MSFRILADATNKVLSEIIEEDKIPLQIKELAKTINDISQKNKVVAIFGNGGSASDAQHIATELVCSYKNKDRKPFKAIALTTDTSIITAWSNDFNFEGVFARQIEVLNSNIGLALGLSTSGNSANVINGLKKAKELGITNCIICGSNYQEKNFIEFVIKIPSTNTAIIQTVSQVVYHSICEELEK